MKGLFKVMQARVRSWLAFILFLLVSQSLVAQNERKIANFPGYEVVPACETYDGAVLLTVQSSSNALYAPCFIVKQTMDGKELWRIRLNHISLFKDLIETGDSGFAVCATVNMYPGLPLDDETSDTFFQICVMKFDKCAKLEWARYIRTGIYNVSIDLDEGRDGNLFVSTQGINSSSISPYKGITILKFSKLGKLLNYFSIEGIEAYLFKEDKSGDFFLKQWVYVPDKKDSSKAYVFTCLTKINENFQTVNNVVLGYSDQQLNFPGPALVSDNQIITVSKAVYLDGKTKPKLMFAKVDLSLNPISDFVLVPDDNYGLFPSSAWMYGDSIAVLTGIFDFPDEFKLYSSVRLYDKEYKLLKEQKLNNTWTTWPFKLLPLKAGNRFIASVVDRMGESKALSIFYLFDRHLNPQPWPTTPPVKGYDWACNNTIPKTQEIDVDKVVSAVYVEKDTTRPDWSWLLSIREPDPQDFARISNGWIIWPQPAVIGESLHLRAQDPRSHQAAIPMKVQFYDLQGRHAATVTAMPEASGQWTISSLNLPSSGLYLADLLDGQTGVSVGRIRVMINDQ